MSTTNSSALRATIDTLKIIGWRRIDWQCAFPREDYCLGRSEQSESTETEPKTSFKAQTVKACSNRENGTSPLTRFSGRINDMIKKEKKQPEHKQKRHQNSIQAKKRKDDRIRGSQTIRVSYLKFLKMVKITGRKMQRFMMLKGVDLPWIYDASNDHLVDVGVNRDNSQVHHRYGDELGLSTDDEMDYIAPDDLNNVKAIDVKNLAEVSR